MLIGENITMAITGLLSNKMRAFLTMLGIIIGIGSVITIMTVGDSVTSSVTSSMQSMGANNIIVSLQQKSSDDETEEGEIYRSGLMKTPQVQSGSYDHTTNSMYGSDSLTLEYSFGNDIELDEITFNTISSDFMENQMLAPLFVFSGDIYFYNYNTGIYDKIDNDREKFEVSELLPYLSPGNTLTVKYIDTSQEDSGWDEILPMLMVKGREK